MLRNVPPRQLNAPLRQCPSSSRAVTASAKETPCLRTFCCALAGSHSTTPRKSPSYQRISLLTHHPLYANMGIYRRHEESQVACRFPRQGEVLSAGVQDDIGYALYAAQLGERSPKAKALHGLGAGVAEIAVRDVSGAYRVVYTASIGDSIYVIHAFQKKSKSGIATPKAEIDQVRQRLKQLRNEVKDAQKQSS